MTFKPKVTIPDSLMLEWEGQVRQYPPFGSPGLSEFTPPKPYQDIKCLLWRDEGGKLRGILNYYPTGWPGFEKPGNANVWVDPTCQRQGIGTKLMAAALERWPIDFAQQRYSKAGKALVESFLRRG